ncbi:hypothetical protein As57867_003603, partial [Aphanomyces stellatus]
MAAHERDILGCAYEADDPIFDPCPRTLIFQFAINCSSSMINDYMPQEYQSIDRITGAITYPWYRIRQHAFREALAEGAGMYITMAFLNGVIHQVNLGGATHGGYFNVNLGVGLAFMMGIHACGGVSG